MAQEADDPRPVYMRLAEALRTAIADNVYAPGDRLPTQAKLAQTYDVAPMTVQSAIRHLAAEGLVVSRQGSGTFVLKHAGRRTGLRAQLDRVFGQLHVRLDFAGFTGETFHDAVQESLDKIRLGRLTPESLRVRMLLSDFSQPLEVPCMVNDRVDSGEVRQQAEKVMREHTMQLVESFEQIKSQGLVHEVSLEIRVHKSTPVFKLFALNTGDIFLGFYPVREKVVTIGEKPEAIYDLLSKDITLFHHSTNDGPLSNGARYVQQAQNWFESTWNSVARPFTP